MLPLSHNVEESANLDLLDLQYATGTQVEITYIM